MILSEYNNKLYEKIYYDWKMIPNIQVLQISKAQPDMVTFVSEVGRDEVQFGLKNTVLYRSNVREKSWIIQVNRCQDRLDYKVFILLLRNTYASFVGVFQVDEKLLVIKCKTQIYAHLSKETGNSSTGRKIWNIRCIPLAGGCSCGRGTRLSNTHISVK